MIYLTLRQVDKYTILLPLSLLGVQGLNIAPHWAVQDVSAHCSSLVWGFGAWILRSCYQHHSPCWQPHQREPLLQAILGSSCLGLYVPRTQSYVIGDHHFLSWHSSHRRRNSPNKLNSLWLNHIDNFLSFLKPTYVCFWGSRMCSETSIWPKFYCFKFLWMPSNTTILTLVAKSLCKGNITPVVSWALTGYWEKTYPWEWKKCVHCKYTQCEPGGIISVLTIDFQDWGAHQASWRPGTIPQHFSLNLSSNNPLSLSLSNIYSSQNSGLDQFDTPCPNMELPLLVRLWFLVSIASNHTS